jgi:four helix bundle protein
LGAKYEQLEVWRRSLELSVAIYRESVSIKDYGFRDQLTRSALSIPSNIAEGYERDSSGEILQFLKIAKGSAGELRTQLLIGQKAGFLPCEKAESWADEAFQLGRMLGALQNHHRSKRDAQFNASS